jgi:hypothetical protein
VEGFVRSVDGRGVERGSEGVQRRDGQSEARAEKRRGEHGFARTALSGEVRTLEEQAARVAHDYRVGHSALRTTSGCPERSQTNVTPRDRLILTVCGLI